MRVEIDTLKRKNTQIEVLVNNIAMANKKTISTMWTYKYKFDEQNQLGKFKPQLVAHGNLQHTKIDMFIAILAACFFSSFMVITAAFDLGTHQYNVVNAFANLEINKPTFCKIPLRWIDTLDIFLCLQFYGLKQSSALWYKKFSYIQELEPVFSINCVFTNAYIIVFLQMTFVFSLTSSIPPRLMSLRQNFLQNTR